MSNDSDWLPTFVAFVLLVGLMFGANQCHNASEEKRCESLRRQKVPAYISEGNFTKKCHVVGREIVD